MLQSLNNQMKKIATFILLSLCLNTYAFQGKTLEKEFLISYAPALINARSFIFELGYTLPKTIEKYDYSYNAFVEGVFKGESYKDSSIETAAIGAKGGVILPTQKYIPLSLYVAAGLVKAVHQKDPWFGKNEDTLSRKDLLFLEGGLIYIFQNKYLLRYSYELDAGNIFQQKNFFSLGVNF